MGPSELDAARHQRVQRRLLTGQSLMRPRAWSDLDGDALSSLQAMQLLFVLVPLELSLHDFPVPWNGSRFANALVATPWPAVLAVVVGCGLVNVFLLAGKLRRETPAGLVVKPWLHALGLAAGGVAVLWLSVLAGWAWVRTRRPSWAFQPITHNPHLDLHGRRARDLSSWDRPRHGRRFFIETLKFVWLFFANVLALGLAGLRLSLSQDPASRQVTLWAAILAHVLICIGLIHYQTADQHRNSILGRRSTAARFLPLLCLLPLPFLMLGFLVVEDTLIEPRSSTLTTGAYRNRLGPGRVAAWSSLQRSLARSSALRRLRQRLETAGRAREPGVLGERLTRLYRLKTALLAGDALALGWLLSLALSPEAIDAVLDGSLYVVLRTAAAGYLLALGLVIARAAGRARVGAHVYGPALAAGHLTFLAGLYPGALLAQGRLRDAGILIALSCAAAAMVCVLSGMLGFLIAQHPLDAGIILWPGIILTMALVGIALAFDDPPAHALAKIVLGIAFLSPLWHAVLTARFEGSLVHPFDVRRFRSYPPPIRRSLAVLAATLALPLGGLAVPYWIYVRRRHWPAYERLALGARP
jgi:hypothetical protein